MTTTGTHRGVARLLTSGALVLAVALAGCGREPHQWAQDADVSSARQAAIPRLDAAVEPFASLGEVVGRTAGDWCDPGEDTIWTSAWRFKCGMERRLIIAPHETDAAGAARAMREALTRAGCEWSTASDEDVSDYLDEGLRAQNSFGAGRCTDGTTIVVLMFRDPAQIAWIETRGDFMSDGFWVTNDQLPASAADRVRAAEPFVWWVAATEEYFYEPR